MTVDLVPNAVEARARQGGEATLRARPWLGARHRGADLAGRHLHDRRPFLLGLWLAGAVTFIVLAVLAAGASRFPGDLWVSRHVQAIDSAAFSGATDWAEDLGDAPETTRLLKWKIECSQFLNDFPGCVLLSLTTPNVVVVFMGAVGVLLLFRRRYEAALLVSTGGALLVIAVLERIVARPQPSPDLLSVAQEPGLSAFSFPSGHTAGVVVLYGLLFYFAATFIRRRALRLPLQAACVYITVFTAIERLDAGVHWLSDVYAGILFGALWLAATIWVDRRRLREQGYLDGARAPEALVAP